MFLLVTVRAFSFERWGLSKWGPVLQYSFDARQDADVLIFGDSSAFLGIEPKSINSGLKVKSLVLPNTIGSLPITGEISLQSYLARNRPPKLLVLYFTAWDLDYRQTAGSRVLFEGEEMLLHNGSWQEIFAFARHHPLELLAFPIRFNSTLGLSLLRKAVRQSKREEETSEALGHVDYAEPYPPLPSGCAYPPDLLSSSADASVKALIRRYTTSQTEVLVYLAPMPDCQGASVISTRQPLSLLRVAPPAVLPAANFAADGLYAHPLPGAVFATSRIFQSWLADRITGLDVHRMKEAAVVTQYKAESKR